MKKNILLSFFIFHSMLFCYAQSWLWGKEATGDIKANDYGGTVAVDNRGNAYMTSDYTNTITFGPYTFNNYNDGVYLVKYNPSGMVKWAVQPLQQSAYDASYSTDVATDLNGHVYITGVFADTVDFGGHILVNHGGQEAFLAKYDTSGNVIWAKQPTGNSFSYSAGYSVASDNSGNVYITGEFQDTASFGAYTLTSSVGSECFLVKYDAAGNVIWAKQSLNPHNDSTNDFSIGYSVTTDNLGNVYVAGGFIDTISFGPYTITGNQNAYNGLLVKYSSSGNVLWAVPIKSIATAPSYLEYENTVITDNAGNVYVAGNFADTVSIGSYTLKSMYPDDLESFLAKFSPAGNVIWAKQSFYENNYTYAYYYGGNLLSKDANNGLYMLFPTDTSAFTFNGHTFNSPIKYNYSYYGSGGYFIAKLDTSGKVICATPCVGGLASGIGADVSGQYIYASGAVYGDTLIFNTDTLRTQNTGGDLPYIARWQSCCTGLYAKIQGNNVIASGDSTVLTAYPTGTSYLWSNGATTSSITVSPTASTDYSVTIYDSLYNCPGYATLTVYIEQGTSVGTTCGQLFIPNAFSPNGDGQNDILYVKGDCINYMNFVIYDRWGNKVFESNNQNEGWDGTDKGKPLNTGTYVYYLNVLFNNGSTAEKKGNIALVR